MINTEMACLKCQQPIQESESAHYGLHMECFTTWFKAPPFSQFDSLKRRSSSSYSEEKADFSSQNASFFHGKFRKYSAELTGESFILKMRQADAPELPEVEYLCNQIGKYLGIPVADFYYISFNEDKIFVTRNFIKHGSPINLQHIYHFRPDDQHNCKKIIHALYERTQSVYDVNVFVRTLLFDALIGNHDRHGRNLAIIRDSKGETLSPIYDNVSYLSLEKGAMLKADFNPTGKISTQHSQDPSMKDYVQELKILGFSEEITSFHKIAKLEKLEHMIDKSYCSKEMKQAMKKLIKKRHEELQDAIKN